MFRVTAAAGDIGSDADRFTFVQRTLTGDGVIVAHLRAAQNGDALAKAGVMIRESLDPQSAHVFALSTGSGAVRFQRRRVAGGGTVRTSARTVAAPWLKVERHGATFTAFRSSDGATWREIGTDIIPMADTVLVGLAVTSGTAPTATADFSTVSVTETAQLAAAAPPAGWSSADVGLPALAGSEQENAGTFSVSGGGVDVAGVTDQFHYLYKQVSGDVNIVARVTAVQLVNAASKGGVMIRDSLTPNGAHASMFLTAGNGPAFVQRAAAGDVATTTPSGTAAAPYWLKLELRADTVTAFQSADGLTWAMVGAVRLTLPSPYYVGLAVSSQDAQSLATATFDNVLIGAPSAQNQPPTISLTAPDTSITYTAPATITIAAAAADTDGTISSVDFFEGGTLLGSKSTTPYSFTWSNVPQGLYTLTAVAHDNGGAATTSDARSASVQAQANQPPTVSMTSPADGAVFTAPATVTLSADAADPDGGIARVDFFAGSTLVRTATTAPYTATWSGVASGTYTLTAVATDNAGATTTSAARTITVNQRPTVSLTAPANGATFNAPATIVISANASDADGTITKVTFSAGSTVIGTDTSSPYSVTWSNVPAGTYTLRAVATDNLGATRTSGTRTITVANTNQPPSVSLTSPAAGATFAAPATITVDATASDTDGTIAKVDFFAGSTLIGSDATSPYSVTWNNVPAGSYSLTAIATDNGGASISSAARTVTVTGTGLPAPWTAADIGTPSQPGSTQYANGTYTVRSTGEVGGTADQFHFVYQPMTGDIDIRTRVASIEAVQPWSKAGVMVRETLAPDAVMGMMFISASSGSAFHQRLSTGAARVSTTGTAVAAPYWVRLERRGTTLTASQSADGTAWAPIGTMTVPASTIYVGLAVASADAAQLATGALDNVTVTTPANQAPTVSLTAPANSATFKAPATVVISANASDADGSIAGVDFYAGTTLLGTDTASPYSLTWSNVAAGTYSLTAVAHDNAGATTTSAARSITVANNQPPTVSLTSPANGATFTAPATVPMSATAGDTDGTIARVDFFAGTTLVGSATASPYNFTWNNVPAGTYALTAVARDDSGATTTSAARSITVNSPANQPPAVSLTAPANGATFTAPASITVSASASDADGTVAKVDFFAGTTLIGTDTTSPHSVTWNNVAAGSYSLTAVATDNAGATATSAARTVTVTSTAPPAPWTAADIGSPAIAGSTQYSNGTFTVDGAGADIWGTSDQFRYVYQQFTGDIDIRAHVVSLENTNAWAKAGLMLRDTLAANAAHTSLVVTGANGTLFFQRATTGDVTSGPPAGGAGAPLWVRLERHGTVVTGSSSTDGATWTVVSTSTMTTPTMYIGLIVTSHDATQLATGVFDNVTVTTPVPNQAPTVSLTAPANGATFTAPASVIVSATASDTDGTIARVDFFAGTTLIGTDATGPYSITWNNVAAGSYSLTAVATDNGGATTTSAARTITVNGPPNQAPAVSLTAPANGATFTAPASITVSATASDTDGTIARVDFFAGTTLIGSDTTSPYSITWNNVPAGSYSLTAAATDNGGAGTTSAARTVTVAAPPPPPPGAHALFAASADHDTLVTRYVLDVFASGANPNTATPIASQDLGKPPVVNGDCNADISASYNSLAAGSYIATVSAVGSGGSSRSAATPFTK
ncbi:MAG TPA: Ig-like domain-containing protein [Vicinamibacterales bacterium]|nr:Ig-like domain-containing protein [Vicinamibacterales bacterium]